MSTHYTAQQLIDDLNAAVFREEDAKDQAIEAVSSLQITESAMTTKARTHIAQQTIEQLQTQCREQRELLLQGFMHDIADSRWAQSVFKLLQKYEGQL